MKYKWLVLLAIFIFLITFALSAPGSNSAKGLITVDQQWLDTLRKTLDVQGNDIRLIKAENNDLRKLNARLSAENEALYQASSGKTDKNWHVYVDPGWASRPVGRPPTKMIILQSNGKDAHGIETFVGFGSQEPFMVKVGNQPIFVNLDERLVALIGTEAYTSLEIDTSPASIVVGWNTTTESGALNLRGASILASTQQIK